MGWTITLSPQVNAMDDLSLSVDGDTITINGDVLDLSPMNDGDTLDAEAVDNPYVIETIRTANGTLYLTLLFPLRRGAPDEARFPQPITITTDGPVPLPANAAPPEEED
jgi:hypothetical protein